MRLQKATVLLLTAFLLLTGCAALESRAGNSQQMTEENYAAADVLIQQSRSYLSQDMPVKIGVLTEMDNPQETTSFGHIVAQQIGSRFVQLGYSVRAATPKDTALLTPQNLQPAAGNDTEKDVMIDGQYAVGRDRVLINLRIIDTGTGHLLASYDYTLPYTRDVRELNKTKAEKDTLFGF